MKRSSNYLTNIFYFDKRSLGLTRIALASTLLIDLFIRISDLETHYTDFGVLPRTALLELSWQEWFISIHLLSGNYYVQIFMFLVAALFAFFLLTGRKTRLSTVVSWLLLISLQNRNPMILQGGDVLLRCLLFWGMFIPWGDRFSVDSIAKGDSKEQNNSVFSIGAFAFVLQISIMYVFTALLKTGSEWVRDFSAIYYVLSLDQFRLLLGNLIYSFPTLMKTLTFLTYWVELLGTILFFIPVKTGIFRTTGFLLFFLFQLGLLLTLRVGLFPVIAISSLFILLPSGIWDRLSKLQDILNYIPSFTYRILKRLNLFDHDKSKTIHEKSQKYSLVTIIVIFFIGFVIYWNIATATGLIGLHNNTIWLGHLLRIDQKWDMFAPRPYKDDGWYVIPGKLRNGERVDVFREDQPLNWIKPDDAIADYKNYRWRKYMRKLWLKKHSNHRLYYGKYLCRKWNREHEYARNLMNFDIYYMKEDSLPDYKTEEVEKIGIWQHRCF